MGIGTHRDSEGARQPKVRELQVVRRVNEKVLRLQVAVQDAVRVAVEQARVQLVREFL